ncbi:MAG: peptidylprolyl isomerase [Brevinema sp.]
MSESNLEAQTGIIQPINPKNPVVTIETEMGVIKAEIFEDKAPITAANFLKLVKEGFYNGIIFHRIIKDFMIQTGDPQGTGMGGPGYTIKDEFHPHLKHVNAGVLSMANAGPDTGGSQFFITLVPTSWLDGKHAVFGQVIQGLDIVKKIGAVQTGMNDKPVKTVSMKKVTVNQ